MKAVIHLTLAVAALFFLPQQNQVFWISQGVGEWYGELHLRDEGRLFVLAKNEEEAQVDFGANGIRRLASQSLEGTTIPRSISANGVPQHTFTLLDASVLNKENASRLSTRWVGGRSLTVSQLRVSTAGEDNYRFIGALIIVALFSLLALIVGLYFAERIPALLGDAEGGQARR